MEGQRRKLRLGDVLLNNGVISSEQLTKALEQQKGSGKKLGEVLVEEGYATEDAIAGALARQMNLEMVNLQNITVAPDILNLVPMNVLKKDVMFPFEYAPDRPNVLRVAMADPMDMYAQDDITIITNCQVEIAVATTRSIMLAIDKYYGQDEMDSALEEYTKDKGINTEEEDLAMEDINSSPIVMLVKDMIEKAVRQRASDIHIEPMERIVRVRYRIDGALYERAQYNIKTLAAIAARIKIIGGMDIAEKRKPQDGRITQVVDRTEYDIRVSVLPTVYGEKIVMRL
ncbi:MAG: Flp pilus assembly complex ATPase component TadA, partial [Lachnospiraceae bacterium]|nr:Flp pilus assembly complex ATPase component TadA [Lachnospiraceae bacterium]